MRLLHTTSLDFHEFFHGEIPRYAILSHRWGDDEASYQDWLNTPRTMRRGCVKVIDACRLAVSRNQQYIWIDTVCIDKRSSAELSEAINSMFKWYSRAAECYAFLPDVLFDSATHDIDLDTLHQALYASTWFTRGWTLQELLAPSILEFFDSVWTPIGSKSSLAPSIKKLTGIDTDVLHHPERLFKVNIARRMSWSAQRSTSREEDMAYCLLGMFDVNMALLYGEGAGKAFFRLQLEILRSTDDDSIFAWVTPGFYVSGMLAPNPAAFRASGDIQTPARRQKQNQRPWTWTNLGLELWLPDYTSVPDSQTIRADVTHGGPSQPSFFGRDVETYTLTCWKRSKPSETAPQYEWRFRNRLVSIRLKRHGNSWRRVDCDEFLLGTNVDKGTAPGQPHNPGLFKRQSEAVSFRLVYVLGPVLANRSSMIGGGPSSKDTVDKAWKIRNMLTLDSGDFRSYWSLLVLNKLVYCIAQEEESHLQPHYHSFYPNRFFGQLGTGRYAKDSSDKEANEWIMSLDPSRRYVLCHYFDLIGGAGFGGLIATMLGRLGMTVSACIAAFEKMNESVFWSSRSITDEIGRRYGSRPKYDAQKLEEFMRELCDRNTSDRTFLEVDSLRCQTFVSVIESTRNDDVLQRAQVLRSYKTKTQSVWKPKLLIPEVVTAATAATDFLQSITLHAFVPGVLGAMTSNEVVIENGGFMFPFNPTTLGLWELAHEVDQGSEGTIVSVGTACHGTAYSAEAGSLSVSFAPITVHLAAQKAAETDGFGYYRLDPDPGETTYHVKLDHPDEWEPAPGKGKRCGSSTMVKMLRAFNKWYANPDVQNYFIECAQSLVAKRRLRTTHLHRWAQYTADTSSVDVFCCPVQGCHIGLYPEYQADDYLAHLRMEHDLSKDHLAEALQRGVVRGKRRDAGSEFSKKSIGSFPDIEQLGYNVATGEIDM